jgi:hypothetical protein
VSDARTRIAGRLTMRPRRFARPAVALAGVALLVSGVVAFAAKPARGCTAAEFRQFDFFAGDWDAYDVADSTKIIARNHVTPMLDGCALRERYVQNDGLEGESFSTYDEARHGWHQSWITNHGSMLLLDGGMVDGRMVLTATERGADGKASLLRGVWWTKGSAVRERAERSTDGGATWSPVFDMVFWPHGTRGHRG